MSHWRGCLSVTVGTRPDRREATRVYVEQSMIFGRTMGFSIDEEGLFHRAVLKNFGDLTSRGFTISSVHRKDGRRTREQLVVDVKFPACGRGASIALLRTPDGAREALTTFLHKEDELGGFAMSTYLKFRGSSGGFCTARSIRATRRSIGPRGCGAQVDQGSH